MFTALLCFGQLISTALLKINHCVIAHLIARAMLPQNPAGELNAKFLDHVYLLLVNLECNRKRLLLLSLDKSGGSFSVGWTSAEIN